MERRALLAAILCMLVWVAYQEAYNYWYPPPPESADDKTATETSPAPVASGNATAGERTPPAGEDDPAAIASRAAGRTVVVDTDLYTARLTTAGGRLESFRLKNYRASIDETSEALEMVAVAPSAALPLGVRFLGDDGRVADDTAVVYEVDRQELALSGDASDSLRLSGRLPSGASIEKTLEFTGNTYPIGITVGSPDLTASFTRVGLGWRHYVVTERSDPEAYYRGAVLLIDNKLVHELATSLVEGPPRQYDKGVAWAGYNDHYFLAALVPEQAAQSSAVVSAGDTGLQILVTTPRGEPTAPNRFTLYVGPKDVAILESVGFQLARAVDFGMFAFLAVPLLRLLKFFNGLTGNYGVDIVLLTILVKVLFIPLSQKSMKSMRDMQRLQPQMAKLREKFKDDRERLNKEMIELYRRHRVNPLGGCLPMLLQFPVFIGLYQTLNQAIELRHASFALWIRDLSTYECYPWPGQGHLAGCNDLNVFGLSIPLLVVLMGASMILQQWLTPSTGMDPAQQRMMMVLMPVMFTVMFVTFPSGLVLYWLVNNVLTIAQQWWTNRAPT